MNKTPIAALLTDTHLKEDNIDVNKSIYRQFLNYCNENNIPVCFHAGDIFNSRKALPLNIGIAFNEILDSFIAVDKKLIAIAGNHDKTNYESEESYLDLFQSHPNFFISRDYKQIIQSGVVFHLIPFFKESTVYQNYLEKVKIVPNSKNILITHVAIDGVMNNDGSVVKNSLSASLFDKFDLTIVGHYHNEQWINDKIWYCGSSIQHNFGEDTDKGMIVIYDDCSVGKIKLDFPEYHKHKIDLDDIDPDILLELQELKEKGNNVRLEISGEGEKLKAFDKSIVSDLGIEPILKPCETIKSLSEAQTTTHNKNSLIDAFKEFCKENNVEDINYGMAKMQEI